MFWTRPKHPPKREPNDDRPVVIERIVPVTPPPPREANPHLVLAARSLAQSAFAQALVTAGLGSAMLVAFLYVMDAFAYAVKASVLITALSFFVFFLPRFGPQLVQVIVVLRAVWLALDEIWHGKDLDGSGKIGDLVLPPLLQRNLPQPQVAAASDVSPSASGNEIRWLPTQHAPPDYTTVELPASGQQKPRQVIVKDLDLKEFVLQSEAYRGRGPNHDSTGLERYHWLEDKAKVIVAYHFNTGTRMTRDLYDAMMQLLDQTFHVLHKREQGTESEFTVSRARVIMMIEGIRR